MQCPPTAMDANHGSVRTYHSDANWPNPRHLERKGRGTQYPSLTLHRVGLFYCPEKMKPNSHFKLSKQNKHLVMGEAKAWKRMVCEAQMHSDHATRAVMNHLVPKPAGYTGI